MSMTLEHRVATLEEELDAAGARMTAQGLILGLVLNAVAVRSPEVIRNLSERLEKIEAEQKAVNRHSAFLKEIRVFRQSLRKLS